MLSFRIIKVWQRRKDSYSFVAMKICTECFSKHKYVQTLRLWQGMHKQYVQYKVKIPVSEEMRLLPISLLFEAELAISLLLTEVTLRKTWSQREGPELCNVWTVPSQVRLPCPLDYLALWWVMIITLCFEIDTTDGIYRGLTCCKKDLHACST